MAILLNRFRRAVCFLFMLACVLSCPALQAQSSVSHSMPRIVHQDGRYALFVDGAPYLILGAQINNSSAWPAMLPKVWSTVAQLRVNTVEAPIYWEQFEPTPGHFDPSVLHVLIDQARQHHVHLVLLWFGTWKNGSGHYMPEFMKLDETRYPHVINAAGRKVDSLSPQSQSTLDADRTAFVELMRDIKAYDPQHTVLMIQVENESGTYGSVRDYSPAAQKAFEGQVPVALLKAMDKQPGTWQQVFGNNADEYFHAWSIAHYIDQVAAAGKAVYPLPFYVNAALRDPLHSGPAGTYDTGGPTYNVIPIWKAAATSIDIIAPDIYLPDYTRYTMVLDQYHRADNPMFVPETGSSPQYARYFFAVLGHQGIGFSPFGMDATRHTNMPPDASQGSEDRLAPFALNNEIFGPMQREIARLNLMGKLQAVAEDPSIHLQTLDFGKWQAIVSYGQPQFGNGKAPQGNTPPDGGAMVAQLGPNEFLVTAVHARVDFQAADTSSGKQRQFLKVQEGYYENGNWHFLRIWNGDQTDYGLNFTSVPQVLRVSLATY